MKTLLKLSLAIALIAVVAVISGTLVAQAAGPGGGPGGMMGWGGQQNSLVAVAAKTMGLTQAELVTALQGGKSIADVAKEKNVTLDKIVDAFVAVRQEALSAAVSSGHLTQAQADSMLSLMKTNVLAQLNKPFTPRGPGYNDANKDGQCDNCGMMNGSGMRPQNGPRWGR